MCITLLDTEIGIAKEDIICYKVMEKRGDILISPYHHMRYECGTTYVSETPIIVKHAFATKLYVEEGFHSFVNLSDALFFLNDIEDSVPLLGVSRHTYVIVKCIIPKGTAYVEGSFSDRNNTFPSFCSEKIICEGKIKNE